MKRIKIGILMIILAILLSACNKGIVQENVGDRIGIIGAMEVEVNSLKSSANISKVTKTADMEFCEGTLHGKDVVIVQSGMGKVNAGVCASILINQFSCTHIINTGVGGSLDDRLGIGDIVVSTDAVQHDFDMTYSGYKIGEIPYTGLYAFEADERLRNAAVAAVKDSLPDVNVYEGRICSGDQFISTSEQLERITSTFGGLCCEMEGAAIAQVCYLHKVPFVIIRAISDKPDETSSMEYEVFEKIVAKYSEKVVNHMLEHLQ